MRISLATLSGVVLAIPLMVHAQSAPYWQQKGYQRGHGHEARGARIGGGPGYLRGEYRIRQARYRSDVRSFLGPAP